jgi:hypothetical protein
MDVELTIQIEPNAEPVDLACLAYGSGRVFGAGLQRDPASISANGSAREVHNPEPPPGANTFWIQHIAQR